MAIGNGKYKIFVEPRLTEIEGWARDGVIDANIAKKLGIAYSTFRLYKQNHLALSATLQKGKEVIDYEVENALLKRALGYEYKEVTKELVFGKKIIEGEESGDIYVIQKFLAVTKRKFPNLILNMLRNRYFLFVSPQYELPKEITDEQKEELRKIKLYDRLIIEEAKNEIHGDEKIEESDNYIKTYRDEDLIMQARKER